MRVVRRSIHGQTIFSSPYFELDDLAHGIKHVFAGSLRVASELSDYHPPAPGGLNPPPPPAPPHPGVAYFFHLDHLGSTGVLTTQTGQVQESLEYFVDGEQWIDRGSDSIDSVRFSGKPFDLDSGFYDFGQRFYDARTSVWLGNDPAVRDGTAHSTANPIALASVVFAGNSPERLRDPDGRQPVCGPNPCGNRFEPDIVTAIRHDNEPKNYVPRVVEAAVPAAITIATEYGLDLIPLYGTVRQFRRGNYLGGTISLLGDLTLVAGLAEKGLGLASRVLMEGEAKEITVTSWASEGITPDLKPGRWVQIGGPTKLNFWKTGLPGPKGYRIPEFPWFKFEPSNVPFSNSITGKVPAASLLWPPGKEFLKGLFGQRILDE